MHLCPGRTGVCEDRQEDYHGIYFSYKEFTEMHTVMAGKNQIGNAAAVLELICVLRRMGYHIADDAGKKRYGTYKMAGKIQLYRRRAGVYPRRRPQRGRSPITQRISGSLFPGAQADLYYGSI